jgi:hypothetical protein
MYQSLWRKTSYLKKIGSVELRIRPVSEAINRAKPPTGCDIRAIILRYSAGANTAANALVGRARTAFGAG